MKKLVSGMMLTLLMLGTLTLTLNVQPAKSSPATITVPDDYATIQAAINAANSGDTIYVRNGIYSEHIEVNKTVTLTGESNQNTIIEANEGQYSVGIDIRANNTIVENFRIVPPNSTDPMDIPTLVEINGRPASCSNDTVRNCVLVFPIDEGAQSDAIDVYNSSSNTVTGNLITIADKTDAGIAVLFNSAGNLIDNNTVTEGWVSIAVEFANNNTVSNNYLSGQTPWDISNDVGALFLALSSGDIVKGNTLINNYLGFSVVQADCSVYHNNFINNTHQALNIRDSPVLWDNGYPSGGNYWSDYNGTDSFRGAYQNITGSDGIGDTPYKIPYEYSNTTDADHYPLMKPWTRILGDINGDGVVDLKDLVLMAFAYGSTPGCTNWDANADLDGNGRVDLTDLVTLAMHYGQHNP